MWSLIAVASPVAAIGFVLAWASLQSDETAPMGSVFAVWIALGLLTLVATFLAFRRRERARWLTLVGVLLMLTLMFGGVSVE